MLPTECNMPDLSSLQEQQAQGPFLINQLIGAENGFPEAMGSYRRKRHCFKSLVTSSTDISRRSNKAFATASISRQCLVTNSPPTLWAPVSAAN